MFTQLIIIIVACFLSIRLPQSSDLLL